MVALGTSFCLGVPYLFPVRLSSHKINKTDFLSWNGFRGSQHSGKVCRVEGFARKVFWSRDYLRCRVHGHGLRFGAWICKWVVVKIMVPFWVP